MIRRFIERCCGKEKVDRIVHWWCNPGRGNLLVIFLAVAIIIVGMIWMSITLKGLADSANAWDKEMAMDRANLQSQIDFLESRMPLRFPEGGP